jgi:putative membrane protein
MHDHAWAWKPDVFAATALAVSAAIYMFGLTRMLQGGGRVRRLEMGSCLAGWLTLAIALLSPIATLSEWLFAVHMTQHELLMLVAAPLLAIGRPVVPMLWAFRSRRSHSAHTQSWMQRSVPALARVASSPFAVFLIHAVALWIWHIPALYEAAVLDDRIHLIQHVCFTGTAALFWWGMIRGRYGRLGYGAAFLYIFATAAHSGGLGALMALSSVAWYPLYVQRAPNAGDALIDQQLGGFIMWIPAGVILMLFGLAMFAAWLGEGERRRQRGWS